MTPSLVAGILAGRPQEERLPRQLNVRGEFPEPLPSQKCPDTFTAKAGFTLLAKGTEGGEIAKFPSTCGPELSRLEPYHSLLPDCTAWWLSKPYGLRPRSSGRSLLLPW